MNGEFYVCLSAAEEIICDLLKTVVLNPPLTCTCLAKLYLLVSPENKSKNDSLSAEIKNSQHELVLQRTLKF